MGHYFFDIQYKFIKSFGSVKKSSYRKSKFRKITVEQKKNLLYYLDRSETERTYERAKCFLYCNLINRAKV